MTDRSRLTYAWLILAFASILAARAGFLALKAWDRGQLLPATGWALLIVWFLPVAFFMAVWIRRIHKEPDVFNRPAPSEVSLSGTQAPR